MNVTVHGRTHHYRTVTFDVRANAVLLIEQRLLPHEFRIVPARDFRQTAQAIKDMIVRGAGAIGATAAYGLAQGAHTFRGRDLARFLAHVETVYATLKAARPTAVDPVNAMNYVRAAMRAGKTVEEQQALALAAAEEFAYEDVRHCEAIGQHGAKLIRSGMNVLTHCNAGWLAFVDIGSATAPMYAAQAQGRKFHVYCDETRPRSQGATLTAWELAQQKVSHQVIADNAAGHLMQRGKIDLVIVGSDRTLGRTGEVANKIGAKKAMDEANAKPQPMNPLTGQPVVTTEGDIVSHWLAKNAYVFMESGSGFGKVGANYVRMNVATNRKTLKAGLDSVSAALKNLA